MGFEKIIILLFVSILISDFAIAQQTPAKKDSTHIYENIEAFSKQSKFTKFLYRIVFKPVNPATAKKKAKKKGYKKPVQKPYSAFEGKIIRHINIETLDPFGYSISDTLAATQNFFIKVGNDLHVKSQPVAIRNLLLIRQNQLFDSLLVKESERLVRSRGYVHDVSFFVKATSKNSDSVDIFIRELDNWSIIPKVVASNSRILINLTDKNFIGFGHEFQNGFTWHYAPDYYAYTTNYYIPNIRNTYINATLHYNTDQFNNFTKSVAVDRPFFSPLAKWAAGAFFTQEFSMDSALASDSLYVVRRIKFNAQDYWAGNASQLFKGNTENNRTTNFISTVRLFRIRYLEKPIEAGDAQPAFSNENFYMASIGISSRKYVQDKYIFKYGVTEDVPVGKVYNITGGYQEKNNSGRIYFGLRFSSGNYHRWGYLSSNFEYGTFIRASHTEQGVFTAGVNYFTGLFEIGTWKFRQFVKPQVTIGISRFSSDSITLNDGYGLDGFNSPELSGIGRVLFTMQTQSYCPWNIIGFRFGPYVIYSLGLLSDNAGFTNSKVYSQFGFGVLIKNENLVFSTFQISLAFYPIIPGTGLDVFKMNSFKATDFGFRDFEIGKPGTMVYQ